MVWLLAARADSLLGPREVSGGDRLWRHCIGLYREVDGPQKSVALCVVEDEDAALGWVGGAPVEAANAGVEGVSEEEAKRREGCGGLVGGAGRAGQPHEDCVVGLGGAGRVERELAEAGM
jgi:hypothetical protein